jgi:hypothetical protein
MNKYSNHPNWKIAIRSLSRMFPGSASYDLDDISGLTPGIWESFDVDVRDSKEITDDLLGRLSGTLEGPLIVVNFACFRAGLGPIFVDAEDFTVLVEGFPEVSGEPFVDGDVVILCLNRGRATIIHHDGLIAALDGNPLGSSM